jgi:hypothetical protein
MKSSIFWDIALCRIWGSHSGGYEEFYLLGYDTMQSVETKPTFRRNTFSRLQAEFCLLLASCWFLAWLILRPWICRRHIPPKSPLKMNGLYGVISMKIKQLLSLMEERETNLNFCEWTCREECILLNCNVVSFENVRRFGRIYWLQFLARRINKTRKEPEHVAREAIFSSENFTCLWTTSTWH